MPKPLLNYTTTIAAEKTISEIVAILVAHRAESVATDYSPATRKAIGVRFVLAVSGRGSAEYRLPVRVDRALARLGRDRKAGTIPPRLATPEQAERVAWRNAKAWLAAQFALVDFGQAEADEVLLPYRVEGRQTVFELYVEGMARQLEKPHAP